MSLITASTIVTSIQTPLVRAEGKRPGTIYLNLPNSVGLCSQALSFDRRRHNSYAGRMQSASLLCAAAMNARCGAEQTQTVTRESSTISIAPTQGKEKSPELDDGGSGFPPRDDGDGGGGGGGGGGGWKGGFFFFGFLAFLGFLKDQEGEGPYRENRRK